MQPTYYCSDIFTLDKGAIADVVFHNFTGTFQKQSLVWRKFVKNYLRNGGLSTPVEYKKIKGTQYVYTCKKEPLYVTSSVP